MKIKITAIGKRSAHYKAKEHLIGCVGEVMQKRHMGGGWHYVEIENCQYPEGSEYFEFNGDNTSIFSAKFEIIEE